MTTESQSVRRKTFFGATSISLMVLGTIIGSAVGVLAAYEQRPVTYRSDMQLLILRRGGDVPAGQQGAAAPGKAFEDVYIPTHQTLIKSQLILSRTLNRLKESVPKTIPPGSTEGLSILYHNLKVGQEGKEANIPGNCVLNISFTSPDPEESRIILETLHSAYDAELADTFQPIGARYLKDLTTQQENEKKKLDERLAKEQEISKRSPLVAQNMQAAQGSSIRLLDAQKDYREIQRLLVQYQVEIKHWTDLIAKYEKEGKPRSDLFKALPREYSPERKNNDPLKKADPDYDPLSAYLDHLKLDQAKSEEELKQAQKTLAEAQAEANEVGAFLAELSVARTALEQSKTIVDNLNIRIAAVKVADTDAGYSIRAITPPSKGIMSGSIQPIFIPAGAALGFFGGAGLASLVLRRRIV